MQEFWGRFDESVDIPAWAFFLLLFFFFLGGAFLLVKWKLACVYHFHSLDHYQSTVAHRPRQLWMSIGVHLCCDEELGYVIAVSVKKVWFFKCSCL